MRESSIILYKNDIIDVQIGDGCQVNFDFDKAWKYRKFAEELKFYHVHPAKFLHPSVTDINCMKGFNLAFSCPVYFSIIVFENDLSWDFEYQQLSLKLIEKELEEVEHKELNKNYLQLLKTLSYGVSDG